jgi:hypothetical protein
VKYSNWKEDPEENSTKLYEYSYGHPWNGFVAEPTKDHDRTQHTISFFESGRQAFEACIKHREWLGMA